MTFTKAYAFLSYIQKDILEKIKGKLCKIDFLGICDDEEVEYFIHGRRIKIHESYNPKNNWVNDIALIELAESVPHLAGDKAPHIQAIKLNDGSFDDFPNKYDVCYFQGWGCTESGGSVNKNALQVRIPIYPNEKCQNLWRIDTKIQLCAGMESATTTMGICPVSQTFVQLVTILISLCFNLGRQWWSSCL